MFWAKLTKIGNFGNKHKQKKTSMTQKIGLGNHFLSSEFFGGPPVKEYIDWKLYQLNCEMFGLSTSCLPMFSPSYCSCWGRCPPPCQPPPEPRGSAQPLVGNHLNSQEGRWSYPGNRQGKGGLSQGNPLAPQALEMFVFIGPMCTWGPIIGSPSLYIRHLFETLWRPSEDCQCCQCCEDLANED